MASKRRIKAARDAFGDADASRRLHAPQPAVCEAGHKSTQTAELDDYLRTAGISGSIGMIPQLVRNSHPS